MVFVLPRSTQGSGLWNAQRRIHALEPRSHLTGLRNSSADNLGLSGSLRPFKFSRTSFCCVFVLSLPQQVSHDLPHCTSLLRSTLHVCEIDVSDSMMIKNDQCVSQSWLVLVIVFASIELVAMKFHYHVKAKLTGEKPDAGNRALISKNLSSRLIIYAFFMICALIYLEITRIIWMNYGNTRSV